MADNIEKTHESLINDSLANNAARILSTKQVIEQYENQIKLFKELPTTLKKSVLVPIGSKGFLRGQIVHTNEVFHNVGSGYVIKRTAKQAIDFCERMLIETNSFLTKLHQEEKWLTSQLNITSFENPFASKDCVEIVENFDEENESEWRKKHRESVKKWKQDEAKEREIIQKETSDKDVFSRLDELEILEELEQFTSNIKNLDFQQYELTENTESTKSVDTCPEEIEKIENSKELTENCPEVIAKIVNTETTKVSTENCPEVIEKIENTENIGNENTKKYLDFVELHKLNENMENLHNKSTNDENKNSLDIITRKLEIEEELEKSRISKTVIRNDEDLMKRLDELEKEEDLLEEMEILTNIEETVVNNPTTTPPIVVEEDDSKKYTIRFNEQVRTNFYVSTKAVSDELETDSTKVQNESVPEAVGKDDDEPVTLFIHFSHSDGAIVNKPVEIGIETVSEFGLLKPSDIYDLPYRPKSILKNKNRLFEEPQHTGEPIPEPVSYSHRKKDRGRDRWVCYDSFSSKNGNDSDQENANVVQVPPPLTEVKEKTDFNNTGVASTTVATPPPKKRQSRFLVSRALINKK